MTTQQSIYIEEKPSVIFDYLVNVENRKNYIPALEKVIMLDAPPIQLGSKYIEVANIAGRRLETTYQVIAFEKNKRITAKTLESIFPIQANLSLKQNGIGCDLTIDLNFKLTGIFRMGSRIVKGIVNQQAKDILGKVKKNIE